MVRPQVITRQALENHRPSRPPTSSAGQAFAQDGAWAGSLSSPKTLGGHRRYPEAEIRELANQLQVPTTT